MLKDLIFAILRPFVDAYIRLRFKDYWALKEHLRAQERPNKLLRLCYDHYFMDLGSYVGLNSIIHGKPFFPHRCQGVFISDRAELGRDVVIFQHVTIGANGLPDSKGLGSPVIGDGAYIGAGAKIIGGVTVGDHCRIGANAVVYQDMPPHSVAVCAPTRIIQKENLDNTFRVTMDGVNYVNRDGRLVRDTAPAGVQDAKQPVGV